MGRKFLKTYRRFPVGSQEYALPFCLVAVSLLLGVMGDDVRNLLQFDRHAILFDKEWWRLVTGHLVHDGWSHLLLNGAGVFLVWGLTGHYLRSTAWWYIALLSALLISAAMLVFVPELQWYMGLSGLLHALFATGITAGMRKHAKETFWLALLLIVKILWESVGNASFFTAVTGAEDVITEAHLFGVIGGILFAMWVKVKE